MIHRRRRTLWVVLPLALTCACASLPTDYEKTATTALTNTEETSLGEAVSRWTAAHDGQSGFYPLAGGLDAFGARLALIDRAERSIDAQYFLIKRDGAGLIFAAKLVEAADRGVRVRFLLDDVFTTVEDQHLLLLDQHPNIEIRLFNPIARGGMSWLNFVLDFKIANRRMHNKSFTVDNQATIVGGRNIAEEYFQLTAGAESLDFDMLAFGPVAPKMYRRSPIAFGIIEPSVPISAFSFNDEGLPALREELGAAMNTTGERSSGDRRDRRTTVESRCDLASGRCRSHLGRSRQTADAVSRDQQILVTRMAEVVAAATKEVIVSTPYTSFPVTMAWRSGKASSIQASTSSS